MANKFKEFFYPTMLDRDGNLLPKGVDEGVRRIYDQYYGEYHAALIFYRNDAGDAVLAPVTVGNKDSGGTGFRVLRVPNG
jgi:hypothetical protein